MLATEWENYHAVKDTNGHSVADKIEDAFWLRDKYEDAYSEKAKQHVRSLSKPAKKLTKFRLGCIHIEELTRTSL